MLIVPCRSGLMGTRQRDKNERTVTVNLRIKIVCTSVKVVSPLERLK